MITQIILLKIIVRISTATFMSKNVNILILIHENDIFKMVFNAMIDSSTGSDMVPTKKEIACFVLVCSDFISDSDPVRS